MIIWYIVIIVRCIYSHDRRSAVWTYLPWPAARGVFMQNFLCNPWLGYVVFMCFSRLKKKAKKAFLSLSLNVGWSARFKVS